MASKSAQRMKEMIVKAIDDHVLTRSEYDQILTIANEDFVIDNQERALLGQLQEMIENGAVKFSG